MDELADSNTSSNEHAPKTAVHRGFPPVGLPASGGAVILESGPTSFCSWPMAIISANRALARDWAEACPWEDVFKETDESVSNPTAIIDRRMISESVTTRANPWLPPKGLLRLVRRCIGLQIMKAGGKLQLINPSAATRLPWRDIALRIL